MSTPALPSIALMHGGFVDGSGWQAVHDLLVADGYGVAVVQNPTASMDGDVTATKQVLDDLDGPVVLVGHSYGRFVARERTHAGVLYTRRGTRPISLVRPDLGIPTLQV
jgi:pimeloyl-ACP methyl ester carboxylesterase